MPFTCTGAVRGEVVVPSPNCPAVFEPQHTTVPFDNREQVETEFPPLATCTAVTTAGVTALDAVDGALVPTALVAVTVNV